MDSKDGAPAPAVIRPWKTVVLGRYTTAEQYYDAIEEAGRGVNTNTPHTMNVLRRIPLAQCETPLELYVASVRDIGFSRSVKQNVLFENAARLGFGLCPAEVGPAAALVAPIPPHFGQRCLIVAMPPTDDGVNFYAGRNLWKFILPWSSSGLTLSVTGQFDDSDPVYEPDHMFIWCRYGD